VVIDKIGKGLGKATRGVTGLKPIVIEWRDASPTDIVWRYPDEVIPWGSTVIVKEWERALFYRDGKVYGVLEPGRHVLDTQNVPFLQGLVEGLYGESIFRAIVIFVNINRLQGRFGGQTQTVEAIPVKFSGSYYYRVADPVLFVNKVVGPDNRFTTEELDTYIRSYFQSHLMAFLSQASIRDIYQRQAEAGKRALFIISKYFEELGLLLEDVIFESIDVPEDYRKYVFWLLQGAPAPYLVQQETAREFAKAIRETQAGGAAFGAAMVALPYAFQPPPQQTQPQVGVAGVQQAYTPRCPYCGGAPLPQGAKFCPYCGKPLKWCPNGHVVPAEAKFCPVCGAQVG